MKEQQLEPDLIYPVVMAPGSQSRKVLAEKRHNMAQKENHKAKKMKTKMKKKTLPGTRGKHTIDTSYPGTIYRAYHDKIFARRNERQINFTLEEHNFVADSNTQGLQGGEKQREEKRFEATPPKAGRSLP